MTRATTIVKIQEIVRIFSRFQTEIIQIPGIYSTIQTKPAITPANVHPTTPEKIATYSSRVQWIPVKIQATAQTSAITLISLAIARQRTPTKPVQPTFRAARRPATTTELARTRRISRIIRAVVRGIILVKIASISFHAV